VQLVSNLEAELGLALMFASTIPTLTWARIFPFAVLRVFGVADLACDLGIERGSQALCGAFN
jgi:hypothetical protein